MNTPKAGSLNPDNNQEDENFMHHKNNKDDLNLQTMLISLLPTSAINLVLNK